MYENGEPIKDYALEAAVDAARADRRAPRRVRALRQPPPAHRRRADPGGLPHRPLPHGARRARAPHHRGLGHDHPADDHQHPPGRGRAEGVLRLLAAVAVHGPDELAVGPHPPPPPVGARRRRPHARARADRGARRPPDPLRPHVPDRDAGGPEHRPDRLAVLATPRSPSSASSRRPTASSRTAWSPTRSSTSTPTRRRRRSSPRRTPRSTRRRQARGPGGHLPLARRRARPRRAEGRRPHGRLAGADLVGRHRADPVPRARRRQPRAHGLEHAAPGRAAAEDRGAADRHRHRAPRRPGHGRRGAGPRTPARSPTSTPSRS